MPHLLPWLGDHLRHAAAACGADSATVFVPTPWNPSTPGLLVHVGEAPPLPELASVEAARSFAETVSGHADGRSDRGGVPTPIASASPEGRLVPIPMLATLWHRAPLVGPEASDDGAPQRRLSDRLGGPPIVGWLGLRFAATSSSDDRRAGWPSLLEQASSLAATYLCFHGILTDPVTGLPGRADLNSTLSAELDRARTIQRPFSLIFVKLCNLAAINERAGRQAGDSVLREFLDHAYGTIRRSDTIMRYGGSVLALPLPDVTASGATIVGDKLRQALGISAGENAHAGQLQLAIGVATYDGATETPLRPLDLLRRADQALAVSERQDAGRVVHWQPDGPTATIEHLDPLLGVFTGQAEKDYRNMRLLWDVVHALSGSSGSELAEAVVGRLMTIFSASRAAFIEAGRSGAPRLVAGQRRLPDGGGLTALGSADLTPQEWALSEQTAASLEPAQQPVDDASGRDRTMVAVPMVIDGRSLGTLLLTGSREVVVIDATDYPVFARVASQLALALDRERLAEQERARSHRERLALRAEVDRLRVVAKQSQFVFQSQPMADLLATARRVAVTDATVLVTGESGTGKELLAHTVHQLGSRRHKPLVIVDCGAIPTSLIDSELFGRERGAYTGAERRAEGRLALADGGTVFLDEIGELPLEVQAKLLRFVQEKTITMVGGTRPQKVDVRIIAATNRPLEQEVRAGRFREDLFHRLNVVRLRVPPLRERAEDVLFLARHFLDAFARQYAKPIDRFEPAAEDALVRYDWPGNVRELENTILQAVVLSEGPRLSAADLHLGAIPDLSPRPVVVDAAAASPATPTLVPGSSARLESSAPDFRTAARALADRLVAEIVSASSVNAKVGPPLGRWLARDVVLEAFEQAGQVAARAAALVGLPETTFSRRLRQAQAEALSTRTPESWAVVVQHIRYLVKAPGRPPGSLLDHVDDLLLGLVLPRMSTMAHGASLMGVTVPTMKRRVSDRRPTPSAGVDGRLVGA